MSAQAESAVNSKWRPALAWTYVAVCLFDFLAAPILWSVMQTIVHGNVAAQWDPITLRGAGLFHLSMGGILGVAAYGRTQEKISQEHSVTQPPRPPQRFPEL